MRALKGGLLASAAALMLQPVGAAAQETTAQAGQSVQENSQDIVVTARKREETLFEVPAAVTAISSQQVTDARLQEPRDLLQLVPSAFLQENSAGTARDISIRGVGTPTLFAEPGVALYVDDIYSSGFISFPTQFYDLERIEVLRGPQGALYGRNAVGGAVNVLSARPTADLSAMIRGTYARYDRYEVEGMVNLPIGENGGIRASGLFIDQNRGEYRNQTTGGFIDKTESISGRVVAQFRPSAALTATLVFEHTDADVPGTNVYFPGIEGKRTIRRDTQPRNSFNVERYSAQLSYETDGLGTFTFVVGGRDYELDGVEDTDLSTFLLPVPAPGSDPAAPAGKQESVRANGIRSRYGELRWFSGDLGGVEILAGVSYLDDEATGDIVTDLPGVSLAFTGGLLPATLTINNDQSVKSWAGFAEVTVALAERLDLIGSLRYTDDEKRVNFVFTPSAVLQPLLGPQQRVDTERGFDQWTPGLTLAWRPGDWNIYGKVQTGFRAGGFNFNVANAANLPFDEETSVNYEIGVKRRLLGGRAFLGLTGYVLTQDDVLVSFFDNTAPPGLQGYLDNAGEARTLGLELEGSVTPVTGVTFTGTLGYVDAEFTSGTARSFTGAPIELDGRDVPGARKWTYSLAAGVNRPITPSINFVADTAYSHRSSSPQSVNNPVRLGSSDLWNVSAGLDFGVFDIRAFVQNLLDDDYVIAYAGSRGAVLGEARAPGRTYGVSARARF